MRAALGRIGRGAGLLLLIVCGSGCAWVSPPAGPKPFNPQQIIQQLNAQCSRVVGLKTSARIWLWLEDGSRRVFSAAILVQRPNRLRLEVLNLLGQPMQILACDGQRLVWYDIPQHQALVGEATGLNIYRLVGIQLETAALVGILLGGSAPPTRYATAVLRYSAQESEYLLEVCQEEDEECGYRLWLEPGSLRPLRLEAAGRSGRSSWQAAWSGYVLAAGYLVPRVVELWRMDGRSRLRASYERLEVNPKLRPENFRVDLPEGTIIRYLGDAEACDSGQG